VKNKTDYHVRKVLKSNRKIVETVAKFLALVQALQRKVIGLNLA